jgi:hypothetical protein
VRARRVGAWRAVNESRVRAGAGDYRVVSGTRWTGSIYPVVRESIRFAQ